ncbi:putative lipoate--protein ligase b-like protein [Rosellinia necatrix]|uniref:Putative lipoate--protein ligase b-like protein n=1 Tax=Rosellinia necatrix TaxID=77044 RepID=A0A1W2TF83_ROSNE|nr:putative lipoate--protein ligase b-like protein [Rosellinia necatrix]
MASLRYIPLRSYPGTALPEFPTYSFAVAVQAALQQEVLSWKARPAGAARGPAPPPTVLCFTPAPTYTLGRRQTEPLSGGELARLRSPLFVPTWGAGRGGPDDVAGRRPKRAFLLPEVVRAPRGGLTTYHGPGQLVIWPVLDLRSPLHAHLSVRDYACLLEKTTIAVLELWGIRGFTTDNPGVWVRSREGAGGSGGAGAGVGGGERKIAALGVHLRRHVTGLGVAINYSTPVTGPAETNPWARIVACGLGDRGVTSVRAEMGIDSDAHPDDAGRSLEGLAKVWQSEFHRRLEMNENPPNGATGFDIGQSARKLAAQFPGGGDSAVKARPISDLEA